MIHPQNSEAVTWLVTSAVAGVALLFGAAWISEKTRRKAEHPKLGKLAYSWGSWSGEMPHYRPDEAPIKFELPGPKSAPDPMVCETFLEFWNKVQEKVSQIRPLAIEEFRELFDEEYDHPEANLLESVQSSLDANEEQFEEHWVLHQLSLSEESDSLVNWTMEFEVSWDEEHSRSAYLDSDGEILSYNLSCAGHDFEEDVDEEE